MEGFGKPLGHRICPQTTQVYKYQKNMKASYPTYLLLFSFAGYLLGHPGHGRLVPGERTWKDPSGKFSVQATFQKLDNGKVFLRKEDGTVLAVTLSQLSEDDRVWISQTTPPVTAPFQKFADKVKARVDKDYLYVESDGMPAHPMMVGITAWQQQVPIPQPYNGDNSWRIPRHPVPAKSPMSAKTNFFRGAIALAVNGVPIFNPIKNNGVTDTFLAGELDKWGGHCGRADDYHYHIAPVHLEQVVGVGSPIAFALDGYPIYGFQHGGEPLDSLNGHKDSQGNYHYHATKAYPYLNGGFYGHVDEENGAVSPQPRGRPARPHLPPLRGAKITGFSRSAPRAFKVEYEQNGAKGSVAYNIHSDGKVTFNFTDRNGTRTETHTPRQGRDKPGGRKPPKGKRPKE